MAYDLKKLTGEFRKRNGQIPPEQMSAAELSDESLKILNNGLDPLGNLGIVIGEDGKVPEKAGVPRIFIMQPNENGVDSIKSLDAAGLKLGSREFWMEAQKGNIFAYPAGSEKPVQISADIKPFAKPKPHISAPVDMSEERTMPESQPYRKPGRFVRFINSIFSGFRARDCEIYRERQKFEEMAKKRSAVMKQEQEELKTAEKNAAIRAEKQAQKEKMEELTRTAGYREHGKTFYRDLVAPTPVFHPEHERVEGGKLGHYTKAEFNNLEVIDKKIEDYSVGGQTLSVDEYCGLVSSCSHDAKYAMDVFKRTNNYDRTLYKAMTDMGYSKQEALENLQRQSSTFLTDDQMKGDLRNNQGELLGVAINPARKQAFEILDKYNKGEKGPLAEKIKFAVENVTSSTSEMNGKLSNGGRNHIDFCASLAGLMDKDPELKNEAMKQGLKQEDIDALKGLSAYSKACADREDALMEMSKAVYEGRELSFADKQKYAKNILTANLMEAKMSVENYEFSKSGKTFHSEISRLEAEAVKNGLDASSMVRHWEKNPEERPFPPEGKFYKDQAYKIVNGFKAKFNQHPDTVLELSDPENASYFKELAEGVVENKGLADMSTKEVLDALNDGGPAYTGSKLVEEAEKVSDRKRLQELGLDELVEDKELDVLNKSMDLGHKKIQPEGPVAM